MDAVEKLDITKKERKSVLNSNQIELLQKCSSKGFDTSVLESGLYSAPQMEQIYYGFLDGVDITNLIDNQFSPLQIKEIREGKRDGLNDEQIALFSKQNVKTGRPEYTFQQMRIIKQVMLSGLDATEFLNPELSAAEMEKRYLKLIPKQKTERLHESGHFTEAQLQVLNDAIESGFDTKQIENPDYTPKQMQEILKARYENNLRDDQIIMLADPSLSAGQMREIRLGYAAGIDAGSFADKKYSEAQMLVLRQGKTNGINLSSIVNEKYTAMQMQVLTDAIRCGINHDTLDKINDSRYSAAQMAVLVEAGLLGHDLTKYVNTSMSPEKMRFIHKAMLKGLKSSELRQIANGDYRYYEMQKKLAGFLRMRENVDLFMSLRFGSLFRNLWNQFVKSMNHHYRSEELYMHHKLPIHTDLALRSYKFNARQLAVLEEAAGRGIDVKDFGNPDMSPEKMRLLMEAKTKGIDTSLLADPEFMPEQIALCIKELALAQKHGYDVSPAVNKAYHPSQMKELFDGIKNGIDITPLLSGDYSPDYMYHLKREIIAEELALDDTKAKTIDFNGIDRNEIKEQDEMERNKKTIFGLATERKLPINEQIKFAEQRRDEQIAAFTKQKTKAKEQAVI